MATPEHLPIRDAPLTMPRTEFEFVRDLASELARGEVRLPSIPDVAARVQRVLDDERATPTQVAQTIGTDAALAARVLRLANSATFNPTGQPVSDLQTGVGLLGHQLVRCAAVALALKKMKLSTEQAELQPQLQELWRKGTLVASIAYVLARETKAANPDEALVTGLLHNVGRLYILVRAHSSSQTLVAGGLSEQVLHDWHPRIGAGVLGYWKFPASIVDAVADQNAADRSSAAGEPLTDVLIAAIALVPCVFYREPLDDTVTAAAPFGRLELTAADCRRLLGATAQQIRALRDALVG
jgi:HD-like signal output (HDOD) protein